MRLSLVPKLLLAVCLFGLLGGLFAAQGAIRVQGASLGSGVPAACSLDPLSTLGGYVWSSATAGSYLYIGDVAAFSILDASAMPNPRVLSRLPFPSGVYGMHIGGGRAYLNLGAAGFVVVDLADPAHPAVVGSLDIGAPVKSVWANGDLAYVTTATTNTVSLSIVDMQQPASPVVLGTYSPATATTMGNVRVSGATAYVRVSAQNDGIHLVNVSDPASPALLSVISSTGLRSFDVAGTLLYVVRDSGLDIYDTSDPTNPALLKHLVLNIQNGGKTIAVANGRAYLSDHYGNMIILDVSQPSNPSVLGSAKMDSSIGMFSLIGTTVYAMVDKGNVKTLDASNPAQPQVVDRGYFLSGIGLGTARGSLLYLANSEGGFQIIDISNPAQPQPLDHAWTEWSAYTVRATDSRAYVLTQGPSYYTYPYQNKVEIFDTSNPAAIQPIGSYRSEMFYHDIEVVGNRLYVAGNQGVEVVDVSNPANPVLLGARRLNTVGQPFRAFDITVEGNLIYAATTSSLLILDAANPASIGLLWQDATYDYFMAVDVVGSVVYGSGNSTLLAAFDSSDPANPTVAGEWALAASAETLHVSGTLAFSSQLYDFGRPAKGLLVSDISNPGVLHAPTCATLPTNYYIGFVVHGDQVLVSSGTYGLRIYDFSFTPGSPPATATPVTSTPTAPASLTPTATAPMPTATVPASTPTTPPAATGTPIVPQLNQELYLPLVRR
jgi:hypothetical protein